MASTGISDTGATNIYYAPNSPLFKLDPSEPRVHVGPANGHMARLSTTAEAAIPQLAHDFPTTMYVIPVFKHTLVCIGPIFDAECKVTFSAQYVTVFAPNVRSILIGWSEASGAKISRFALTSHENQLPPTNLDTQEPVLSSFSAYDIPSVEGPMHYLHDASRFPVKSMWLAAIKSGNYATCPGLNFYNAAKYFLESRETIKGHMVQTRQGIRSTKTKPTKTTPAKVAVTEPPVPLLPKILSSEIHIYDEPIRKLYTNDCGCFPIQARGFNHYIMIAFHCGSNTILNPPSKMRGNTHRITA